MNKKYKEFVYEINIVNFSWTVIGCRYNKYCWQRFASSIALAHSHAPLTYSPTHTHAVIRSCFVVSAAAALLCCWPGCGPVIVVGVFLITFLSKYCTNSKTCNQYTYELLFI